MSAPSVLAIDTASRSRVVVAVAAPDGALIRGEVRSGGPVGTSLPQLLQGMLDPTHIAVVVVTGPGTYTGVRAGMAAALGIAQSRGLPLHGAGSLEVAACVELTHAYEHSWVASDAGRGAIYVARTVAAATPARVLLGDFDAEGAVVFSTEMLPIDDAVRLDPVEALAAAVPLALSRPPRDRVGLTATYVA